MNNHMSICEFFSVSTIPFLRAPKLPFTYAAFTQNLESVSISFFTRQIIAVVGVSGSGKSALMNYAVNQLDPSSHCIISCELSNPHKRGLYRFLANKCGVKPSFYADDVKIQICDFFENENRQGRHNCIIIDEVHELSMPIISEIRSFYEECKNFSLIFVGLPSFFTQKLDLAVNAPVKRRISTIVQIESITLSETKNYIEHHLAASKARNNIFDEKCFPSIYSFTNGLPGRIDQLCVTSIFEAYKNKTTVIDDSLITSCAQKIQCLSNDFKI